MRDQRFRFGAAASVVWLMGAGALLIAKRQELGGMPLNAWGDFFAGWFAPLAFLWLVLGYLQQGEELRLSTEALRLQAEELKNSVEQQRELVEVSRQQVQSEREAHAEERERRILDARPSITVESDGGTFRGDGQSSYPIVLTNTGNVALGVIVTLKLQLGRVDNLLKCAVFDRGGHHQARIQVDRPDLIDGAIIEATYRDQLGNSFVRRYLVMRQTEHPHASLTFQAYDA